MLPDTPHCATSNYPPTPWPDGFNFAPCFPPGLPVVSPSHEIAFPAGEPFRRPNTNRALSTRVRPSVAPLI
jgi:hypothetical protein